MSHLAPPRLTSPNPVQHPVRRRSRAWRIAIGVLSTLIVGVLVTLTVVAVQTAFAASRLSLGGAPLTSGDHPLAPSGRFEANAAHGVIAEGTIVTLSDDTVPAIAGLNPALLDALRAAERDAAMEGQAFTVSSAWRSPQYQEWLLSNATKQYASEAVAREFVATPDSSSHVTGDGIDIGPIDAQFWLIEHGSRYGICQTYANERWHFELATEPRGVCPQMKANAAE